MDDSALFMQWAMQTLEQEQPVVTVNVNGDPSPSPQALRGGSGGGSGDFSSTTPPAPMDHHLSTSGRSAPNHGSTSNCGPSNVPAMNWNFNPAAAQPLSQEDATAAAMPDMSYGSQPTKQASAKINSAGSVHAANPLALGHIIAERKRREKINQRFIELSTVIPGLKKMDKATILCDAIRHVKQLQEKVKGLEAAGRDRTVVLVKKSCYHAVEDENGSPLSAARNPLPEIEVRFSENDVMARIICDDAKGVVVRVLSEVEAGLNLTIVHSNVMAFTASTLIITITAKMEEGFTLTEEDIVGRLNSVLQ